MQTFAKMTHVSITEAKLFNSLFQCNGSISISVCQIIAK